MYQNMTRADNNVRIWKLKTLLESGADSGDEEEQEEEEVVEVEDLENAEVDEANDEVNRQACDTHSTPCDSTDKHATHIAHHVTCAPL